MGKVIKPGDVKKFKHVALLLAFGERKVVTGDTLVAGAFNRLNALNRRLDSFPKAVRRREQRRS
jgi:hypothetical protein